jgi:rhamnulokinase
MPRNIHCAAVDLGATSGRVIVGTWTGASLTLREVHRFPNAFRTLNGSDYWEIGQLWHEVQTGLAAAAASLPTGEKIASVGVDTWGVDHALLDARGRLVFPVHAYRDARTQRGLKALARDKKALAKIYAATGIPNVFYNASLQLAESVATYPALKKTVARCLFLPDYFNFLLSGKAANEISIASTSQLLGVDRQPTWSNVALKHFGVPADWFSKPIRGQTPLGAVRGLPALAGTTVVAVPGHDTACAYDAMPVTAGEKSLFISSGTWSLVGFESNTPLLSAEALSAGIANERTSDGAYRPLKNVIGLWLLEGLLKDFNARPADAAGWEKLIAEAESLPRPSALLAVDDPAFVNPTSMQQAIDTHLTKRGLAVPRTVAGYVRLICDSLGEGHAAAARQFARLGNQQFARILIVGGGARNRLLCQATADAAGIPVAACELEGTATGNIARQLLGLRAVANLASVRDAVRSSLQVRVYSPRG